MVTSRKPATSETKVPVKRATAKAAPAPAKAVTAKAVAVKTAATAKKPAAAKKAAAPKRTAAVQKPAISAEQRNNYVQVAAFYIAERRGFASANPADDWIAAEAEIDRLIASGHFAG